MAFADYVKFERDDGEGPRVFIVRKRKPELLLELEPTTNGSGVIVGGTFKRLRIPNSWHGDYQKYHPLIREAEAFFRQSLEHPGVPADRLPGDR